MTTRSPNVKSRLVAWIDCHPRTGWYIAIMVTLNVVVSVLDLFK